MRNIASSGAREFARLCAELDRLKVENERLRRENGRFAALALRDELTGLHNRRYLGDRLTEELCRLKRNPAGAVSVICIDVNDFKRVNDTGGHAAGDAALIAIGELLVSIVRTQDVVCRLGGDEFVVLLPDTQGDQAARVLDRIKARAPTLGLGGRALAIGVASWQPGDDEASLLSRADTRMYVDKRTASTAFSCDAA